MATDDLGLARAIGEATRDIERSFAEWVVNTPALDSEYGQMVIFTLAATKLAQGGVGLGVVLKQLFRVYGLDTRNIEVTGIDGETVLYDDGQ